MIELAFHAVAHCCTSLAGDTISSLIGGLGGPSVGTQNPAAEVARLQRESEIERVAFERYMLSRSVAYDEASNERVLTAEPLKNNPITLSLKTGLQDGDVR